MSILSIYEMKIWTTVINLYCSVFVNFVSIPLKVILPIYHSVYPFIITEKLLSSEFLLSIRHIKNNVYR